MRFTCKKVDFYTTKFVGALYATVKKSAFLLKLQIKP